MPLYGSGEQVQETCGMNFIVGGHAVAFHGARDNLVPSSGGLPSYLGRREWRVG